MGDGWTYRSEVTLNKSVSCESAPYGVVAMWARAAVEQPLDTRRLRAGVYGFCGVERLFRCWKHDLKP